tara:strand:- start:555 stop:947 length:393 start_codon:yes stop_codon:yes gene_type:complete
MIEQPEGMVGGLSNCGVVAIASALGLKYPVVWDAVKKAGKKSARWRGTMRTSEIQRTVKKLGGKIKAVKKGGTLTKWIEWESAGGATYIIHTGNHYVAVRDQQVVDQHSASPIGEHKCRKQRVKVAWKIN